MGNLEAILKGEVASGVYRFASRAKPETVQAAAAAQGWRCFYLDGTTVADKASFLAACQEAFALPAYFARNWDALEECINDLSWAPAAGYIVLYDQVESFAAQDPTNWGTALYILRDAAGNWAHEGTPMVVLLRQAGRLEQPVPDLPA
jgi:hypothetical protein